MRSYNDAVAERRAAAIARYRRAVGQYITRRETPMQHSGTEAKWVVGYILASAIALIVVVVTLYIIGGSG